MEKHPLTPMTDPNIRRWLRLQTKGEVGLITLDTVRAGAAGAGRCVRGRAQEGRAARRHRRGRRQRPDGARRRTRRPQAGHRRLRHRARPAREFPPRRQARREVQGEGRRERSGRGALRLLLDRLAAAGRGLSEVASGSGARSGRTDGRLDDRGQGGRLGRQRRTAPCRSSIRPPIQLRSPARSRVSAARKSPRRSSISSPVSCAGWSTAACAASWSAAARPPARWWRRSASPASASARRSIPACRRWSPNATARSGLALKSGNFGADDFFEKAVERIGTA